jgi:hypothetical protein
MDTPFLIPLASWFFVYLWSTNIINFVGDHQMNIAPVVSEKKIKM